MTFRVLCAVLLAGLLTGCASLTGGAAVTPNEIPLLGVNVEYEWYGEGPAHGYTLDVTCEGGECRATTTCTRDIGEDLQLESTGDFIPVPRDLIDGLSVALTGLRAVEQPQEVIDHTDDYPRYTITRTTDAIESIVVHSTSNTAKNIPWNVQIDGQWHVQESDAFADAFLALIMAVKPNACARL